MINYFKYKRLAYYDMVCGCNNRNYLEDKLVKKFKNKLTYVTIIDVDNLKIINDTFGHLAGDHVLRSVVDALKINKSITHICRYGGDEFIVFHKDDIVFEKISGFVKRATGASFSYGTVRKAPFIIFQDALADADARLYRNKRRKNERDEYIRKYIRNV